MIAIVQADANQLARSRDRRQQLDGREVQTGGCLRAPSGLESGVARGDERNDVAIRGRQTDYLVIKDDTWFRCLSRLLERDNSHYMEGVETLGAPIRRKLSDFLNFTALDAGGANPDAFVAAIHDCANFLQVQIPAALRHVMSVADAVSELWAPATHSTSLCH